MKAVCSGTECARLRRPLAGKVILRRPRRRARIKLLPHCCSSTSGRAHRQPCLARLATHLLEVGVGSGRCKAGAPAWLGRSPSPRAGRLLLLALQPLLYALLVLRADLLGDLAALAATLEPDVVVRNARVWLAVDTLRGQGAVIDAYVKAGLA